MYIMLLYTMLSEVLTLRTGDQQGWPTFAFHGRQPPVSQVGEMHVTGETIINLFAAEFASTNCRKL